MGVIVSASRRTDIPAFFNDWFFRRVREGFCLVRNPFNPRQVTCVPLTPELVDCLVFWTKNPEPMLDRLELLSPFPFYFQFTLTGYGPEIEPGIPHKRDRMLPVFRELAQAVGKERVVWRYDPIFFTERYTKEYHRRAFGQIAEALNGYTQRVVISFLDLYAKVERNLASRTAGGIISMPEKEELALFASFLARTARENGMEICTCAEAVDLSACGIAKSGCISRELVVRAGGRMAEERKAKGQRGECLCVKSTDIGAYHTCPSGCLYCYANDSRSRVERNLPLCRPDSPFLCGGAEPGEIEAAERKLGELSAVHGIIDITKSGMI